MTKVVPIFGGPSPDEIRADLISDLEKLIEAVKAGEVSSIAWVRTSPAGAISTSWQGDAGTRTEVGFAINVLQTDFMRCVFTDNE